MITKKIKYLHGRDQGVFDCAPNMRGPATQRGSVLNPNKINTSAGYEKALLFFTGWGMDEYPFLPYLPQNCDSFVCYDYNDLNFNHAELLAYGNIHVIAWSMGVWAAAQTLCNTPLRIRTSWAVNGTPWPIDATRGIPPDIFAGTLQNFDTETLHRFRRRMCGSKDNLKCFLAHAPRRELAELRHELQQLYNLYHQRPQVAYPWDLAMIGIKDRIFPMDNQQKAWQDTKSILWETDHFPAAAWSAIFREATNE